MDKIDVITLPSDKWREYKSLRLQSLQEEPGAYGLLYKDAVNYSDHEWIDPLAQAEKGDNKWIYFARINDELVGMVSGQIIDEDTLKLGEVYVARNMRGGGLGKRLLSVLLEKAPQENPNIRRAKAKVFTSQEAAIGLYKNLGFEVTETITEHWPDGRTNQTLIMYKSMR